MKSSARSDVDYLSLGALASEFASSVGLQAYDTKMMGQRSLLAIWFQVRVSALLQSTMINDNSSILPCSKRAFSDILEGVVLKYFLGQSLQTPIFLPPHFDSTYWLFQYVSNDVACEPPFPKHWECYLSVQPTQYYISDMTLYMA